MKSYWTSTMMSADIWGLIAADCIERRPGRVTGRSVRDPFVARFCVPLFPVLRGDFFASPALPQRPPTPPNTVPHDADASSRYPPPLPTHRRAHFLPLPAPKTRPSLLQRTP